MTKVFTFSFVFILLCHRCFCADVVAHITAPTDVKAGNVVFLDTNGSVGKTFRWSVFPESAKQYCRLDLVSFAGSPVAVFGSVEVTGDIVFFLAVGNESDVAIATHVIHNTAVSPAPIPLPPTPPTPLPPIPPPQPSALRVLFLYESSQLQTMPASQISIITSPAIRNYLIKHCPPDVETFCNINSHSCTTTQVPCYIFLDPQVNRSYLSESWKKGIDILNARFDPPAAGNNFRPSMCIWLSDGVAYSGPWPNTIDSMLDLLKKFGGP
jgi:hypothetical protein